MYRGYLPPGAPAIARFVLSPAVHGASQTPRERLPVSKVRPSQNCSKRRAQFVRDRCQELVFQPARSLGFFAREPFPSLTGVRAPPRPACAAVMSRPIVSQHCSPWMVRGSAENEMNRASPDFCFMGNSKSRTQCSFSRIASARTSIRGIHIEIHQERAFSDQVLAVISGHRHKAVVGLENNAVGDAADDESVRTGLKRFFEPLFAFAQRSLAPPCVR